jgi:polyhydroxyalkanoate synthesis regulator phasin
VSSERGVFDFLRARGEEFLTQVSNELMSNPRFIRAMQAAVRGKEWIDQAVAQALRTMNVPTRSEFKRALARIDALERELADLRRQAAAKTKKPARRRSRTAKPAKP